MPPELEDRYRFLPKAASDKSVPVDDDRKIDMQLLEEWERVHGRPWEGRRDLEERLAVKDMLYDDSADPLEALPAF